MKLAQLQSMRLGFLLCAAFWMVVILERSLYPFGFSDLSMGDAWSEFWERLFSGRTGEHVDSLSNFLFFLPFGFFWTSVFPSETSSRRGRYIVALVVMLMAAMFGLAIEFSQLWLQERTTSVRDVVLGLMGTSIGVAIWFALGGGLVRWLENQARGRRTTQPIDWFLRLYMLGFVYFQIHPFDFTIHPGELNQKVMRGAVAMVPFENWHVIRSDLGGLIRDLCSFIPVGAFATVAWTSTKQPMRSFERGVLYSFLISVLLECTQFFTLSRFTDATDVFVGTMGATLGVVAILVAKNSSFFSPLPSPSKTTSGSLQKRWGGAIALMLISLVAVRWRPHQLTAYEVKELREAIRAEIDSEFDLVNRSVGSDGLEGFLMADHPPGLTSTPGVLGEPKEVPYLRITKPGTYSNYLVDGNFEEKTLVKISANGVILKNCVIRNSKHNAITVDAEDVIIDSCHIHHILQGSRENLSDAHGVTGHPFNLLVRNCDIHTVSGDCLQFDPDRNEWGNVVVKNCKLWTAPLQADSADYKRGDCPGENAIDTKSRGEHSRSKLVISRCLFSGWRDGLINNMAALNLKENVSVLVSSSIFENNEIGLRLRGPTGGTKVGAKVTVDNCRIYESDLGLRIEDNIQDLKIRGVGFGPRVETRILIVEDKVGPGYEASDLFSVPGRD